MKRLCGAKCLVARIFTDRGFDVWWCERPSEAFRCLGRRGSVVAVGTVPREA